MSLQSKFATHITDTGLKYVSAVLINDQYKKIPGKSGSTQKKLINELKLEDYSCIWRRNKDSTLIGSIATTILDHFKSQVHDLYLNVDELEIPKEGPNKNNHIKLLEIISKLSDKVKEPDAPIAVEPIIIENKKEEEPVDWLPPIIELEEDEMFHDANDQPFYIETRGDRLTNDYYFKAKDYAMYGDNKRLIEILLMENTSYKENNDYVVFRPNSSKEFNPNTIGIEDLKNSNNETDSSKEFNRTSSVIEDLKNLNGNNSSINSSMATMLPSSIVEELSKSKTRINHEHVYLTTVGLLRVTFASRNPNENVKKIVNWLCKLFYTHQFGSTEERAELAQGLLKTILNDKLSGIYCVSLGILADLYETMDISKETYPPEIYGNHIMYKYGQSKDINARFTQHKNTTTGYARWSKKVTLNWMILVSETQLNEAEALIGEKCKANGLSFNYMDNTGHTHNELIIVPSKGNNKLKTIYKQTLSYFPSKENELCKAMAELQTEHDLILSKLECAHKTQLYELKLELKDVHSELVKKDAETALAKKDIELTKKDVDMAMKEIELLTLKLSIASNN